MLKDEGMPLDKLLYGRFKFYRPFSLPKDGGMDAVNRLPCKLRTSKTVHPPMVLGISPVNLFPFNSKYRRFIKLPIFEGIVPLKELLAKLRAWKVRSWLRTSLSIHLLKLLLKRYNVVSYLRVFIVEGILPLNLFRDKLISDNRDRLQILDGT